MLSMLVRVVYFVELAPTPVASLHLYDQNDMNFFDQWAKVVASGDWLTDRSLHPLHTWHQSLLESSSGSAKSGSPSSPENLFAGKTFHQEPLYPYLIGVTYKVFGENVKVVFLWQMALGLLSIILIYRLAARHFGQTTGLVAAMLAGLCGPMLFYEMVLLRCTLITFATLFLADQADLVFARESRLRWFALGGACGAAITLKSTFILFFVGVMAVLIASRWRQPRLLLISIGLATAGVALVISPVVARNVAVGVSPFSLSSVGPVVFICANMADVAPGQGLSGDALTASILRESAGRMLPAILATLRTHPNAMSLLSLLGNKFISLWNWYEVPDNANFYYFRLKAPVLRYLLTFYLLAPLSLVGMFFARGHVRRAWPLFMLIIINMAIMVVFIVLSRHRIPLIAVLLPFAALALVRLGEYLRARNIMALSLFLASMVILLWLLGGRSSESVDLIRPVDYVAPIEIYYIPESVKAAGREDWPRVIGLLEESLRPEPRAVRLMSAGRLATTEDERNLADFYAEIHGNYGLALEKVGQAAAANREKETANALLRAAGGKVKIS